MQLSVIPAHHIDLNPQVVFALIDIEIDIDIDISSRHCAVRIIVKVLLKTWIMNKVVSDFVQPS